jgi:hypothetical protein
MWGMAARRLRNYNAIVRGVAFESDGGAVGLLRAREDLKCAAGQVPVRTDGGVWRNGRLVGTSGQRLVTRPA